MNNLLREAIFKRLPEGANTNGQLLKAIDVLLKDNENSLYDEEETVTLFIEKFFSGMSTLDISEMNAKYAYACKFVSYRLLGLNEGTAYELTYPDKASEASVKYASPRAYKSSIQRRGRMVSKDAMVIKVMSFNSVPLHVANSPLVQCAIDKLEYLVNHSKDEKIQLGACQTILQELRKPTTLEVEHTINEETILSTLDSFKQMNKELATTSSRLIADGKLTLIEVDNQFKAQISHKV